MKEPIKVLFICHGNICRSTMAQSVFAHLVKSHHLEDLFFIDSAATSREEIGNGPHYGTVNQLRKVNIPVVPHRAVQMTPADYEKYDYLIGMDTTNMRNMNRIAGGDPEEKMYKLLAFKDYEETGKLNAAADVADPWYTGDFETTYRDVLAGCTGLLAFCLEHMK